jgi:hypothetical protein
MPDREKYYDRPGRFGAHNILEYLLAERPWKNPAFLTYFNAGLRAVDASDALDPKKVGYYVPVLPAARRPFSRTTSAPTSTAACT